MCWTERKEAVDIQIADKDIEVYKLVMKADKQYCKSGIIGFTYEANIIYRIPSMQIKKAYVWNSIVMYVKEAYHSYTKIQYTLRKFYNKTRGIIVGNCLAPMSFTNSYYVATFIIPKGSQYAVNWKGEVISNQIIYTGKCLKL